MSLYSMLKPILDNYSGSYFRELHDPIQSHAIYGIPKTDKDKIKEKLKLIGAKRFRTVQPHAKHFTIICFDASGIK